MTDAPLYRVPDHKRVTLGRTVDRHGVISEYNSIEYADCDPDLAIERYVVMLDRHSEEVAEVYSVEGAELRMLDDARDDVLDRLVEG